MAGILLVRQSDVAKLPAPVAKYFEDWSRPYTLFGIELRRVDMKLDFKREDWSRKGRGVGPSHSTDCRSYTVGGTDFSTWLATQQTMITQIFTLVDMYEHECCADD